MLHDVLQRAVLGQPFHCGFRPDLGYAGHVVDRVTNQGEVIDDALGWHTELALHALDIQHLVGHGVDQGHPRHHQLGEVFVTGGNDALQALLCCASGQRANHVVGLDPFDLQHRPATGHHRFENGRDLQCQVFWHGLSIGFVLGIPVVAKGFALGVEHADCVISLMIGQQSTQHIQHAVHRTGGLAIRATQVGHGMKCPVEIRRAVDEQERFAHRIPMECMHERK